MPWKRPSSLLVTAAATLLVTVATAPAATAHGTGGHVDRLRAELAGEQPRLLTSANVQHVASVPGSAGISGCFMRSAPLFVMSNLDSVRVYDVRKPVAPRLVGTMPSGQFENEAMNCGERRTPRGAERFSLIGVDLYQASPDDLEHVNVRPAGGGYELVVVDVTDPADPHIRSRVRGTTSTHTVTCVEATDCRYAYSAGSGSAHTFSIFDLRDLDHPREVDSDPRRAGIQPFASPAAGHKWNFDDAGYGTHTGFDGSAMFDVSRPRRPRLVTTTGRAGRGDDPRYPGYNDFIHHNSFRPNAKAFRPGARPSFANGNVLLVTEEDYEQTDCSKAGSFQTWWVKRLDGRPGQIVPLDKVELSDLGSFPVPHDAFCSAHWFDLGRSGIVAVGFYGGGTQFVDVRNPTDIKGYGHATWGASEVWDTYWVPRYDRKGRARGKTNLAYSVDAVRGLDVYRVALPGQEPGPGLPVPGSPVSGSLVLGSSSPVGVLSRPEESLPVALVCLGLVGSAVLRRRAAVKQRAE